MRGTVFFIVTAALLMPTRAPAEPPAGALRPIANAAEALANGDAAAFLDQFDKNISTYAALRERIEGLLSAHEVGSTVEVISSEGSESRQTFELDWLLILNEKNAANVQKETRRKTIKCTVERGGRVWKITAIEPLEFFAY